MDKPRKSRPRSLSELLHKTLGEVFARRGFAATELVTRWADIAGPEIAAHCQPEKITWPRKGEAAEPATLLLRVEGPIAAEIQHLSPVILERINRFLGWQAVGRVRLRQAPLARKPRAAPPSPDAAAAARLSAEMSDIADPELRDALARLGAAVKGASTPETP